MAGGHGGRLAVAQVTDQEYSLSPYRSLLFQARSSRITDQLAAAWGMRRNICSASADDHARLPATGIEGGTLRQTALLCGIVLCGIAGCAPTQNAAPAVAGKPAVQANATILSMRKVVVHDSDNPWRAALLKASAGAAPATADQSTALMEFIVHADDGAKLSIVQPNGPGLHAGDRVLIERDSNTHLARPG